MTIKALFLQKRLKLEKVHKTGITFRYLRVAEEYWTQKRDWKRGVEESDEDIQWFKCGLQALTFIFYR